ncbi:putative mitochondrial presequence translocated-associated motor subunit pam-17 precursor [Podospora australis]|uniref:Presequence translocated-associated motor subunit PAM17 n=1 Tax=Podospora australis TaxID=1536484 RepID=A0AAN6X4R6_9PEZI|nr:putative mitochondrial presequence translocated-associated motor subunit pam-17 precursor [Podospora australis]
MLVATTMLRASAGRSAAGLQPILLRSTACPYSAGFNLSSSFSSLTTTNNTNNNTPSKAQTLCKTSPLLQIRSQLAQRAAAAAQQQQQQQQPQLQQRRHASSSTTATTRTDAQEDAEAAAKVAKTQAAVHPDEAAVLNWETFFKLRKTRRRWQQAFSVVSMLACGSAGSVALTSGLADSIVGQIPLDPLITLGLMTMSFAALGWLVGPSVGTAVFNSLNSKFKGPMAVKESQFFARIKKNRVDPSASSVRNPVPDFYGEKISSVAGYRQWLRDQRAFNRKKVGAISS